MGNTQQKFINNRCIISCQLQSIFFPRLSSRHLELIVALAGKVPRVVCMYFALLVGEGVPDAQSFPVGVPRSFSLVGGAASSPGEPCRGTLR